MLLRHEHEVDDSRLCFACVSYIDNLAKPIFGHREGAEHGYNPQKPNLGLAQALARSDLPHAGRVRPTAAGTNAELRCTPEAIPSTRPAERQTM